MEALKEMQNLFYQQQSVKEGQMANCLLVLLGLFAIIQIEKKKWKKKNNSITFYILQSVFFNSMSMFEKGLHLLH